MIATIETERVVVLRLSEREANVIKALLGNLTSNDVDEALGKGAPDKDREVSDAVYAELFDLLG